MFLCLASAAGIVLCFDFYDGLPVSPGGRVTFLCSPKKRNQKKGDPTNWATPVLRTSHRHR